MKVDKYAPVYESALREFSSLVPESEREDLLIKVGRDDGGSYLEFICVTSDASASLRKSIPMRFMGLRTVVSANHISPHAK